MLNNLKQNQDVTGYTVTQNDYKEEIKTPYIVGNVCISIIPFEQNTLTVNNVKYQHIDYIGFTSDKGIVKKGMSIDNHNVEYVNTLGKEDIIYMSGAENG